MLTATILLFSIGLLGAFDIAYFHTWKEQLAWRPACRREAVIHVVRGFVYAVQFVLVPSFRLNGAWYVALIALFVVDGAVAVLDVLEEPRSRAAQGGLSGPEYLMHIVLSVLVGAMICSVFTHSWGSWVLPTELVATDDVPRWMKQLGVIAALGCASVSILELLVILDGVLPKPAPLHIRVQLDATVEQVWNLTQDHRVHPQWDHRFSRIVMLHDGITDEPFSDAPEGTPDPKITTGTLMRYEKALGPLVIRGFGRYKLHRLMHQSTFEFWSDERLSLIRKGVGLWRYTPLPGGRCEFATSYTYEVRWGLVGRWVDRLVFRPFFQWLTEQSFKRVATLYFGEHTPHVLGRAGRLPARFAREAA